jgi:hypothetical protein
VLIPRGCLAGGLGGSSIRFRTWSQGEGRDGDWDSVTYIHVVNCRVSLLQTVQTVSLSTLILCRERGGRNSIINLNSSECKGNSFPYLPRGSMQLKENKKANEASRTNS